MYRPGLETADPGLTGSRGALSRNWPEDLESTSEANVHIEHIW